MDALPLPLPGRDRSIHLRMGRPLRDLRHLGLLRWNPVHNKYQEKAHTEVLAWSTVAGNLNTERGHQLSQLERLEEYKTALS